MDPNKIRECLAEADRTLGEVKLAMADSARKYVGQGSLDDIAKDQIAWCRRIEDARKQMLDAYREAR